jgi:cellulose synthase/poly-beta-1,6-N-acetylglucosamine synthase-like glycosyltransferase
MTYFLAILLLLTMMHAVFILWCLNGWKKLDVFHPSEKDFKTVVSVILPVRNEAKNISNCLLHVLNQNYPDELVEVIVVDDQSTDQTAAIVSEVIRDHPGRKIIFMKINERQDSGGYKKRAIEQAIQRSSGELIVTTDADCTMKPGWLSAMAGYYEKERPLMIAGPVCFSEERNNFEKLQGLEFMGLVGIGAGSISNQQPMMCNGANLAYSKKIFLEVNGFSENVETVSGDDTQLLFKVSKVDASKVCFLKSPEAIVHTTALNSMQQLFQQRKRWVSKIPGKMGIFTRIIAVIAYLVHAGLLIALCAAILYPSFIPFFLLIFALKIIPEFLLLNNLGSFFQKKNSAWLFLAGQIIYMVYVAVIGTTSYFGSYYWKEREVKTPGIKIPV